MTVSCVQGIDRRIEDVRLRCFGPRGAARLAAMLGESPTTYRTYEKDCVPPAATLVRMARVTGADLRWLLTGQFPDSSASDQSVTRAPRFAAMVERFADRLGRQRRALDALAAFVDLVEDVAELEQQSSRETTGSSPGRRGQVIGVPVMGRTAAGVPCFWHAKPEDAAAPDALFTSAEIAARLTGSLEATSNETPNGYTETAQWVQYAHSIQVGAISVCEFLTGAAMHHFPPGAFALRVDGDSMSPPIAHGDIVILSPQAPAEPARPAVVKLRGQMGVTCKLYRRQGDRVHLVPMNDAFPTTTHKSADVVWALAVLGRFRTGPGDN